MVLEPVPSLRLCSCCSAPHRPPGSSPRLLHCLSVDTTTRDLSPYLPILCLKPLSPRLSLSLC